MHGLEALAAYLDIESPEGMIIDKSWQLNGANEPAITMLYEQLYTRHPALLKFKLITIFPMAGTIRALEDSSWETEPILKSSDLTWLKRGETKEETSFDKNADIRGPHIIGLSLVRTPTGFQDDESTNKQQRIVVAADGDFLLNTNIDNGGNLDLAMRLINWLSGDDDFISIPAYTLKDTQLEISPITAGIIGIVLMIILPFCLFAAGGFIWWRRKNL